VERAAVFSVRDKIGCKGDLGSIAINSLSIGINSISQADLRRHSVYVDVANIRATLSLAVGGDAGAISRN